MPLFLVLVPPGEGMSHTGVTMLCSRGRAELSCCWWQAAQCLPWLPGTAWSMAVDMRACRFARGQELPLTFLLPISHFAGIPRTAPEDISFGLPLGLERQASRFSCCQLCTQIVPSQLEQG